MARIPLFYSFHFFLDFYFLAMERRFRSLYEHVRQLNEEDIDFSIIDCSVCESSLDQSAAKSSTAP